MYDILIDGNISIYNNFLFDWMEIIDCRFVAYIV